MYKKLQASYTVEAAFVVPLVVWILVLLVFYALYMRDVVLIKAGLTTTLEEGRDFLVYDAYPGSTEALYEYQLSEGFFTRLTRNDESKQEAFLLSYLQENLANKLWVCDITGYRVDVDSNELSMEISYEANIDDAGILRLFQSGFLQGEIKEVTKIEDYSVWNRIVSQLIRTGKKIKGVEELSDMLDRLLSIVGK